MPSLKRKASHLETSFTPGVGEEIEPRHIAYGMGDDGRYPQWYEYPDHDWTASRGPVIHQGGFLPSMPEEMRSAVPRTISRHSASLSLHAFSRDHPLSEIDKAFITETNEAGTDDVEECDSDHANKIVEVKVARRRAKRRKRSGKPVDNNNNTFAKTEDSPVVRKKYGGLTTNMVDEHAVFPACLVGIIEVETFYGRNESPTYMHRVFSNGIKPEHRAKIQMYVRGMDDKIEVARRHDALKYWSRRNGCAYFQTDSFSARRFYGKNPPAFTNYDASQYTYRNNDETKFWTPTLLSLANGVQRFPQGDDAGILTQCVQYAVENNDSDLTVADVTELAQQQGFVTPAAASSATWDQEALDRILRLLV